MLSKCFIYVHGDVNSWTTVTQESLEHWSSLNNDDITVVFNIKLKLYVCVSVLLWLCDFSNKI